MKYVITGGSSFIGVALTKLLIAEGHEVYVVAREGSKHNAKIPKHDSVHIIMYNDMSDIASVKDEIDNADVFVHLAWNGTRKPYRDDHLTQKQNVGNSLKALPVALTMGCKLFVFAGSQAELGEQKYRFSADTFGNPNTEYGKAKSQFAAEASQYCATNKMKFMHLRIVSLYGEEDYEGTMVKYCLQNMLANKPLKLSACTQMWNYLYIADAVMQVYKLCEYALACDNYVSETYLIASEDTRPLKDFVNEMAAITKTQSEIEFDANNVPTVSLDPDVQKTKCDTNGFMANYSFEKGVKNVIEYITRSE